MDESTARTSLTEQEGQTLRSLLVRYCATELDQFDLWRTMTPTGPAHITIARYPNADPNQSPEGWESIDDQ